MENTELEDLSDFSDSDVSSDGEFSLTPLAQRKRAAQHLHHQHHAHERPALRLDTSRDGLASGRLPRFSHEDQDDASERISDHRSGTFEEKKRQHHTPSSPSSQQQSRSGSSKLGFFARFAPSRSNNDDGPVTDHHDSGFSAIDQDLCYETKSPGANLRLDEIARSGGANGVVNHLAQLPIGQARDAAQDALALLSGHGLSLISVNIERCIHSLLPLIDISDAQSAAQVCALCQALGYCDENKVKLVEANIGSVVTSILQTALGANASGDEHLVVDALTLLAGLASSSSCRSRLGSDGVIRATSQALLEMHSNMRVARAACKVLKALALEETNKARMIEEDAVKAMAHTISFDDCDPTVLASVCTAMYFIIFELESLIQENRATVLISKTIQALCKGLGRRGMDDAARAKGLAVLAAIVSSATASTIRRHAAESGAIQVACNVLIDLDQDTEAAADAVHLLHCVLDENDLLWLATTGLISTKTVTIMQNIIQRRQDAWDASDSVHVCAMEALERVRDALSASDLTLSGADEDCIVQGNEDTMNTKTTSFLNSDETQRSNQQTRISSGSLAIINSDLIEQARHAGSAAFAITPSHVKLVQARSLIVRSIILRHSQSRVITLRSAMMIWSLHCRRGKTEDLTNKLASSERSKEQLSGELNRMQFAVTKLEEDLELERTHVRRLEDDHAAFEREEHALEALRAKAAQASKLQKDNDALVEEIGKFISAQESSPSVHQDLVQLQKEHSKLQSQLQDLTPLQQANQDLQKKLENIVQTQEDLRELLEQERKEKEHAKRQNRELDAKVDELVSLQEKSEKIVAEQKLQILEVENNFDIHVKELEALREERETLRSELNKLTQQVSEQASALIQAQEDKSVLLEELERNAHVQDTHDELQAKVAELNLELRKHSSDLEELTKLREENSAMDQELLEMANLEAEIATLREKLTFSQNESATLREKAHDTERLQQRMLSMQERSAKMEQLEDDLAKMKKEANVLSELELDCERKQIEIENLKTEVAAKLERAEVGTAQHEKDLNTKNSEIETLKKRLELVSQMTENTQNRHDEEVKTKLAELEDVKTKLELANKQVQDNQARYELGMSSKLSEIEDLKMQLDFVKQQLQGAHARRDEDNQLKLSEIEKLTKQLNLERQSSHQEASQRDQGLQDKIERANTLQQQLKDTEEKLVLVTCEKEKAMSQYTSQVSDMQDLKAKLLESESTQSLLHNRSQEMAQRLDDLRTQLAKATASQQQSQDEAKKELGEARAKLTNLEETVMKQAKELLEKQEQLLEAQNRYRVAENDLEREQNTVNDKLRAVQDTHSSAEKELSTECETLKQSVALWRSKAESVERLEAELAMANEKASAAATEGSYEAKEWESRYRKLEEEFASTQTKIEQLSRLENQAKATSANLQLTLKQTQEQQNKENHQLERENQNLRENLNDLQNKLLEIQAKADRAAELEEQLNNLQKSWADATALEEEIVVLKRNQEDHEREGRRLLEVNQDLEENNLSLQEEVATLKEALDFAADEVNRDCISPRKTSLLPETEELEELRRALARERNERANLEGELASLRLDKKHSDGTFAELENAIDRIKNLEGELDITRTNLGQSRAESQALRNEIVHMENRTHTRELDAQNTAQKLENMTREYEEACSIVQTQEEIIEQLKNEREEENGPHGVDALRGQLERLKTALADERKEASRDQTHRTELIKSQLETEYRMVIKALTASRSRLEERLERTEGDRLQLQTQVARLEHTLAGNPSALSPRNYSIRPSSAASMPGLRKGHNSTSNFSNSSPQAGPKTPKRLEVQRPSTGGTGKRNLMEQEPWREIFIALQPDDGPPPAISFTSMYNFVRKTEILPHRFTRANCDVIFSSFADQSSRRGKLDAVAFAAVLDHCASSTCGTVDGMESLLQHEAFIRYVNNKLGVVLRKRELTPVSHSLDELSQHQRQEHQQPSTMIKAHIGLHAGRADGYEIHASPSIERNVDSDDENARPQSAGEFLQSKVWRRERKPLKDMFSQYAKRERDPRAQQRSSLDHRTMVHQIREGIEWDALVQMCSDFDIMPSLVGRGQLRELYQEILAYSSTTSLLDLPSWLLVLERIACSKFSHGGCSDTDGPSLSMLQWMDASNGKAKLHGRRRSGAVIRKFNVSALTNGNTTG